MALRLRVDTITKDNAKDAKEEAHHAYIHLYDDATGAILEAACIPFDSTDIASLGTAIKDFKDNYMAKTTTIDGIRAAITAAISEIEKGA